MNEPTREQRMAAIEHVVFDYTYLLSAAHHTLFGAAPWRVHAEKALLLHYRNVDEFLLRDSRDGRILATDYLEPETARCWDLPTWRAEWREHMRTHLDHLGYERLAERSWTPHKWVSILDGEARTAWKQFYDAITDQEYRQEFVRQVEIRRRELVAFHVRVELLYA
ncbi:MAG TPA: hypothetical protein VFQ91_21080 [Bryobacteraceae bacterium]|nr:hypothetical protein [Bryobacteraceae bacterium]